MSKAKLDIRRAMTEHGISYATFSKRTGIDKGNISKLFTGNPTYLKLLAVADAIGVDIRELFYSDDDVKKEEIPSNDAQQTNEPAKVGMIMCPHCHCGFEITGVVTPPTE